MDLGLAIKETAKGGLIFVKGMLFFALPFIAFNIIMGSIWVILNIKDIELGSWSEGVPNIYVKYFIHFLELWPVLLPLIFFIVLMPLLYYKNAFSYSVKKVLAFVLGHAKGPVCDYLCGLFVRFIQGNKTIMTYGKDKGPLVQKEWKVFLRKRQSINSKALSLTVDYVLDKLVIVDFLERIKLGSFDISKSETHDVIQREMESFIDLQIIERFVEPDLSGLYKLMGINVVLIILMNYLS